MSRPTPLARGAAALGLALSDAQLGQLDDYLALLEKWNRVYNLTAIREREQMVTHHLLDSLAVVAHVAGPRVLDVGSGAGLPGLALAIGNPMLAVTVLDSNHKKAAFLRQAVAELGLANVQVCAERVETWQPAARFETIVSRAFAELAEFVTLAQPLLATGGVFAAMKGVHPYEEIDRLPPGWRVRNVVKLDVPELNAERHLVFVERAE